MASGLLCSSQCSLLLFHHLPLEHSQSSSSSSSFSSLPNRHQRASSPLVQSSRGRIFSTVSFKLTDRSDHLKGFKAPGVLSADSRSADSILTVDSEIKGVIVDPDASGGGGEGGLGDSGGKGGGGNGGGGDSSGGGGGKEGPEDSNQDNNKKKEEKIGMSMSKKLTLGYAALVGAGGVMGFVKTGSQKSLIAGGLSASILYYVYTQLPSNPVLASSVGLGVSAALLGVMGLRFKNSGKIFPAGVLSLVSLVMTAGYLHGIMRSVH